MIKRVFRQMLFTQIVSAMTVMICMVIDSIMIGRFLGVDAMTAYGLASPVLLVFAAFGSMLSAGIQVFCGKAMGNGDMNETNAGFSSSVVIVTAVSLTGVLAVLLFTSPLCVLLGAGDPVPENKVFFMTVDYIRGFIIGAPAFLFAQIMVPYMQISGQRTRLVVAVAAMTVSDILFDILNVFVVKQNTFGMGLASSLSYYIAFVIGIVYFFKKNCMFRFKIKLVKLKCCLSLLKEGIPTVINQISLVLLVFTLNKILLDVGGNSAVAAYSVISSVGNLCYCFGSGIGSVALLLASIFYTDEDRTELRSLVRTMSFYAVILNIAVTGAVLALADPLAVLFMAENENVASIAAAGLRIFSLSLLPCGLNTSLKNYYQGIRRIVFSESISVMQNFALTAAGAFLLSRFFGVTGAWFGFLFGESLTLVILSVFVFLRKKHFALNAETYAFLPDGFGAKEGEYAEWTVRSLEESVEASRMCEEFCRSRGETPRDCKLIALCVEEIANNIVLHGFRKDSKGKKHSADIRLTFKSGKRVIRIRDDCTHFDPLRYFELHESDDPASHIGIRMVMKSVKTANYVHSLGLNNLTLIL